MAQDVIMLARALGLDRYAVLGHSFGAFVALQNAVDYPGMAAQTIVSGGVPSMRHLRGDRDEPERVRAGRAPGAGDRVVGARSGRSSTPEDCARVMADQFPFHFGDPLDPRIADYLERTRDTVYAPAMFRFFSANGYGGIEVEDRLGEITQPVLVTTGRHDRTCTVDGRRKRSRPGSRTRSSRSSSESGHMTFVEEPDLYVAIVRSFLERTM